MRRPERDVLWQRKRSGIPLVSQSRGSRVLTIRLRQAGESSNLSSSALLSWISSVRTANGCAGRKRMANTMGAEFDQIELGECSQFGLREQAPAFAQFRTTPAHFARASKAGKRQSFKSLRQLVSLLLSLDHHENRRRSELDSTVERTEERRNRIPERLYSSASLK